MTVYLRSFIIIMSRKQIFRVLLTGGIAIMGLIFIQSYWVINSWYLRNSEFDEKVNIALRRVAEKLAEQGESELPKEGLISRLSTNSYVVNYNNFIDPHILEDFLIIEMDAIAPEGAFEYAIYDCFSEEFVYGNCCNVNDKDRDKVAKHVLELEDYTYSFIVRFPTRRSFLLGQMWTFLLFSILAFIAVAAFIYAIRTIFRQKRLSELQKDFVNNMTHEFKTPLSSIRLSAMVLEGASEIQENKRLTNYAKIISDQSKRLSSQVENVLDIVRSEKKFILSREEIDLVSFLRQGMEVEKVRFEKNDLEINEDYQPESLVLSADPYHLSNVFSNIVENAVKYASHEGVDNKAIRLDVNLTINQTNYQLCFSDNGIGIEEKHQKLIFNKFYRVPTGNVHNVKGFGLGLYYVRNICQLHGWSVKVESKKGKGSRFCIEIPMNEELLK